MLHHIWSFLSYPFRYILPQNQSTVKNSGGWYGTNDFRYKAVEGVEPLKGEVIYFELVGWVNDTTPIMPPHPVKDELKEIKKAFGDVMVYNYGCGNGEVDLYVYKIVRMNEDGVGVDLSWPAVKARCRELGLRHVPELSGPFVVDKGEDLEALVASLTEGPSTIDSNHIREGVVLRVENDEGISYIKNKSWVFGVLEGYIKDLDSYVDLEEVS